MLLIVNTSISAQELYSKTYTTKDGLPSSYILNTYEDRLGYLWIGTAGGLSRFDGKYFNNYGYGEGLPDLRTDIMLMDSKLRFWVGTRRGVGQLKENKFVSYPLSDSLQISYVFNFVETKKGEILALTNVGIYRFTVNRWQKIKEYPGYENSPCRGLVEKDEDVYINYGKIIVLKKKSGAFKLLTASDKSEYFYNRLSQSGNGIFVSTDGGIYSIKNEELFKLPGALGQQKGIYHYFFDSKHICWIGSDKNGLQYSDKYDSSGLKTFYKRQGINLISGITEDRHGNLWVADFTGLVKITEQGYKIFELPKLTGTGKVWNMFQSSPGNILINDGSTTFKTFSNGIYGERKLNLGGNSKLPGNELIIDQFAIDNKIRYWYSLRGFGLAMQDGNTIYEQSKHLAHLGDDIFDVLFDSYRKKILVAVSTQKSPCQFNDTGFSALPVINNKEAMGNIVRMHQCKNNNILFATDKGILYSINKENICKQQLNELNTNSWVKKLRNDPNGDLWIVYNGKGIRRYSWQNDSLVFKEQIDKTNGLPNDNVFDLCFDNQKNIWLLMSSGVLALSKSRVNGNNDFYKTAALFSAADLNLEDAYNTRFTKTDDGNIWLATSRHLVCFYPSKIKSENTVTGIQIEDIKLNLKQTDWSLYADSLSGFFGLPYKLQLAHNKNTLGFNYKAVFPPGTDDISYSYILEGLDTTWSPPLSSDFISFVNLPAGDYTFKVKARLPNTNWCPPAVFSFEIKKAFWDTWWFRLLVIVAASGLIISIFQYRLKQIRNKAALINQLQQLENKALKAQMNPHFIFNAMNSIQSLIINNRTEEAGDYISKFAKLMRYVLENTDANLVTIEKELYSLQLYIALEKLRMNVELLSVIETDKNLVTDQEKIPPMVIQPFVENALWHGLSRKQGDKKLNISLKAKDNWIICTISDNGLGRTNAAANYDQLPEGHLSKATDITMQRLISYNNAPAVQPIEIIDLKDEFGNPAGTSIVLQIKRETGFTE
ncbi:MAG: histidine kinase [Chitinophagaceae bacterium]|nr:histidine kinase [Chitinophagaceae bacterium]